MARAEAYAVAVGSARSYPHPHADRTARVGVIPTTGDAIRYKVYGTREEMMRAYYAHSPRCGNAPHDCIRPLIGGAA
jgi:hypothetical protein